MIVANPVSGDYQKSTQDIADAYVRNDIKICITYINIKSHSLRLFGVRFGERRLRTNDGTMRLQAGNTGTEMHTVCQS